MCAPCDRGVRLARLNPSPCPCLSQGDWRSATDPKDCVKWLAHPFDEDDVHRALSKPYPVHIQRPNLPDYYSDLYSSKGRELEGHVGMERDAAMSPRDLGSLLPQACTAMLGRLPRDCPGGAMLAMALKSSSHSSPDLTLPSFLLSRHSCLPGLWPMPVLLQRGRGPLRRQQAHELQHERPWPPTGVRAGHAGQAGSSVEAV